MSTNKNKQQRINQVIRNASLRTWPLPCKPDRTTGCNYFARLRSLISLRFSKTCYAPATAQATIFCPISSEAYLLTGKEKKVAIGYLIQELYKKTMSLRGGTTKQSPRSLTNK